MSDYKVYENQTLQDIAAHVYGSIDVVMDLAVLNNISITQVLQAGMTVKLVDAPLNTLVKKVLDGRGIIPATRFTTLTSTNFDNYLLPNIFPILL